MSTERTIHFQNEPFMAHVYTEGDAQILCTPVVYDVPDTCGVGLFYEGGGGKVWGMISPRNLIVAWRATEVLRRLDRIEFGTLCAAYYTATRNPPWSNMTSYIIPTIRLIGGQGVYNEIMSMPIPEVIIRAILDNQDSQHSPDMYPIVQEVRAGTIQWRQEFADAGLKHPDVEDTEQQAKKKIMARFKRLLGSYDKSNRANKAQRTGMWRVKSILCELVEKGLNDTHPDCVLVALAGVLSKLAIAQYSIKIMDSFPVLDDMPPGNYDSMMDNTREAAITHAARWLSKNSGSQQQRIVFFWHRRTPGQFTPETAKTLLTQLVTEYFPQGTPLQ